MKCKHCKKKIERDAKFCTHCGETINEDEKLKNDMIEASRGGYLCAAITALTVILSLAGYNFAEGISAYSLIDVVIFILLAYGTSKFNKYCAASLFILFVIEKILSIGSLATAPSQIIFILIFLYFFYNGMTASFKYSKLQKSE